MATREFTVALSGKVESGNGIGGRKREGMSEKVKRKRDNNIVIDLHGDR